MVDKLTSNSDINKFLTGFSSFDQITGGGLPKSSAMALIGKAGSGKEILAREIMWHCLQRGSKVLYYSVDQSAEELRFDMKSYGWDVQLYEDKGVFQIVDVFSSGQEKMVEELNKLASEPQSNEQVLSFTNTVSDSSYHRRVYDLNLIYKEGIKFISPFALKMYPHRLVIFDTISPLLATNTEGVFQMLHVLKFASRAGKASGIGILHSGMHEAESEENVKAIADAIIEIKNRDEARFILLRKYPGKHKMGSFPFEVTEEGVNILPVAMPELL